MRGIRQGVQQEIGGIGAKIRCSTEKVQFFGVLPLKKLDAPRFETIRGAFCLGGDRKMIKRCEVCGREFKANRNTARFCSSTCRSRNARGYAYHSESTPPAANASMSNEEVLETIQRAHIAASDLSRASMLTPSPLCLKLGRISRKIENALRSESL